MGPPLKCKSQELSKCWDKWFKFYKQQNYGLDPYGPQWLLEGWEKKLYADSC